MKREHRYQVSVVWTGSAQGPTTSYTAYSRDHEIRAEGRPAIPSSADPTFRGASDRWNPEQLLVASLSECHMLWYLHLCSANGIHVVAYEDHAEGTMSETPEGTRFTDVVLQPAVTVAPGCDPALAAKLHEAAHEECFVAKSVNFPVRHEPRVRIASSQ